MRQCAPKGQVNRTGMTGSCAVCSRSVPQPIDSMWSNNPVRMRLPPGGVPASYPQIKLPVLDNPALFEKLDTEALFFAFYYMPGTHQQYLAARELKRQSWRYHKQHGAWFQVYYMVRWQLHVNRNLILFVFCPFYSKHATSCVSSCTSPQYLLGAGMGLVLVTSDFLSIDTACIPVDHLCYTC